MKSTDFFENICNKYYEKILFYLFSVLKNETAARDCTQEVFLVALQKQSILVEHPNVGGFLFQTAKNLSKKYYRKYFIKMFREESADDNYLNTPDGSSNIEDVLDRQIDERKYIDDVLDTLNNEKRLLYDLYYIEGKPMAEIAQLLDMNYSALRMRYVRLRREILECVKELSEKEFSV